MSRCHDVRHHPQSTVICVRPIQPVAGSTGMYITVCVERCVRMRWRLRIFPVRWEWCWKLECRIHRLQRWLVSVPESRSKRFRPFLSPNRRYHRMQRLEINLQTSVAETASMPEMWTQVFENCKLIFTLEKFAVSKTQAGRLWKCYAIYKIDAVRTIGISTHGHPSAPVARLFSCWKRGAPRYSRP